MPFFGWENGGVGVVCGRLKPFIQIFTFFNRYNCQNCEKDLSLSLILEMNILKLGVIIFLDLLIN